MNAATLLVQVDALAIRFVSEHQCPGDVWMRFRLITLSHIVCFESDGIAQAAKPAAVARNFPYRELLSQ
jgi:hypothetical protein